MLRQVVFRPFVALLCLSGANGVRRNQGHDAEELRREEEERQKIAAETSAKLAMHYRVTKQFTWKYAEVQASHPARNQLYELGHKHGYIAFEVLSDYKGKVCCAQTDFAEQSTQVSFLGKNVKVSQMTVNDEFGWQSCVEVFPPNISEVVFSFALNFQRLDDTNQRVSCYVRAPGFNQEQWFKHTSFDTKYDRSEHSSLYGAMYQTAAGGLNVYREGVFASVFGRQGCGTWEPATQAYSNIRDAQQAGWRAAFGHRKLGDEREGWYLGACGGQGRARSSGCTQPRAGVSQVSLLSLTKIPKTPASLELLDTTMAGCPKPTPAPTPKPKEEDPWWFKVMVGEVDQENPPEDFWTNLLILIKRAQMSLKRKWDKK